MCWWQVWDVGDGLTEKVANIMILSPTSKISDHHKVTNIKISPLLLSPILLHNSVFRTQNVDTFTMIHLYCTTTNIWVLYSLWLIFNRKKTLPRISYFMNFLLQISYFIMNRFRSGYRLISTYFENASLLHLKCLNCKISNKICFRFVKFLSAI